MIDFKEISKSNFEQLDLPILFGGESDRSFGIIFVQEREYYKISWQSTVIRPNLMLINDLAYSIGVDLIYMIFDFDKKSILLELELDYFFYDAQIYNDYLYVITELEIFKINKSNYTVDKTYDLPDYFDKIEYHKGNIFVRCTNGEIIDIG